MWYKLRLCALDNVTEVDADYWLRNIDVNLAPYFHIFERSVDERWSQSKVVCVMHNTMSGKGFADYRCTCDDTNNTPRNIERDNLVVDIRLKPTLNLNYVWVTIAKEDPYLPMPPA